MFGSLWVQSSACSPAIREHGQGEFIIRTFTKKTFTKEPQAAALALPHPPVYAESRC